MPSEKQMQPFHSYMFEEGDSENAKEKQPESEIKQEPKEQTIVKYENGRPVYPTIEKLDLSAINDILPPKSVNKQGKLI